MKLNNILVTRWYHQRDLYRQSTAGLFRVIPENFPLIGNLNGATACTLLMAVFRYFDIDLANFLRYPLKNYLGDKKII